jgi:hypothetical protein
LTFFSRRKPRSGWRGDWLFCFAIAVTARAPAKTALANGAEPAWPPIKGHDLSGVTAPRAP